MREALAALRAADGRARLVRLPVRLEEVRPAEALPALLADVHLLARAPSAPWGEPVVRVGAFVFFLFLILFLQVVFLTSLTVPCCTGF